MKTRIKELRLEKKLSQQALANGLSLNQATLSKIECEISVPDALLVSSLSSFFHVSTDYILYLAEERLNADLLMANNMHIPRKYQNHMSMYRRLTPLQQDEYDNLLKYMLGEHEFF